MIQLKDCVEFNCGAQPHASGHLSDALRDLALRVHEDVTGTEHTVTEDKVTGEVVETLTVRWKRGEA